MNNYGIAFGKNGAVKVLAPNPAAALMRHWPKLENVQFKIRPIQPGKWVATGLKLSKDPAQNIVFVTRL